MKIKNIGERKIICQGGELRPGLIIETSKSDCDLLVALLPKEVLIIEDVPRETIETETKKRKK